MDRKIVVSPGRVSSGKENLPQLKESEAGNSQKDRHDPKTHRDFGFLDPFELEMVVKRSDSEDPLSGQFEGENLQ
jgi:hypothetical protein